MARQRPTNGAAGGDNVYQQLINSNDLVKELDDIEAISQQISQHAEVLYQNWKSNGMRQSSPTLKTSSLQRPRTHLPTPGRVTLSSEPTSPRIDPPGRLESLGGNGYGNGLNGGNSYAQRSSSRSMSLTNNGQTSTTGFTANEFQHNDGPVISSSSSFSSTAPRMPTSDPPRLSADNPYTRLPGSPSISRHHQEPTHRPTAYNTLSTYHPTPASQPQPPPISRAATLPARKTVTKLNQDAPLDLLASPEVNGNLKDLVNSFVSTDRAKQAARQTISSTISNMSRKNGGGLRSPSPSTSSSPFSSRGVSPLRSPSLANNIASPLSPTSSTSSTDTISSKNPFDLSRESLSRAWPDSNDAITIPVQHLSSEASGLRSPSVLQSVNKPMPLEMDFGPPLPSLHMQHVDSMRKRFEEAKQRMNMLHHRAMDGGLMMRPMGAMANTRSLFERDNDMFDGPDEGFFMRRPRPRITEKPAAPHPELTPQQKQHIFERSATPNTVNYNSQGFPIRRFLSGGSVAERVLIFERCPIFSPELKESRIPPALVDKKKEPALASWRNNLQEVQNKTQVPRKIVRDIPIINRTAESSLASSASTSPASSRVNSRPPSIVITGKEKSLPKFHFPHGNPALNVPSDLLMNKFADEFRKHKNSAVTLEELGHILKACDYPMMWKGIVFAAAGGEKTGALSYSQFADFWRRLTTQHHDQSSQFVYILTRGQRHYLVPEDFIPLIQDVVDSHPGLGFLKEATEFHSRYVHTVIARIFFVLNRSWSGRISVSELRRSNFLPTVRLLQDEEDINQVTDFFSYEHFYVIYCKFWELDKDHDLFIDKEDLARHNDHAISSRMIDRIFSGTVTHGQAQREGKMSYTEFVWFLLAEEDKRNPTSIEYWFRCMDLDGDGFLSMYELEYFYEEQLQRMEQLGIETLPFEDCLCQMLDMIRPKQRDKIALTDLKKCRMTPIFFDTFFNLEKYLDHEQRDPFASQRDVDEDGNEMSDWDRFAAEEYELLVAEEGNAEGLDELCYEDDQDGNPEMHLDEALDNEMIYHEPIVSKEVAS